MTGTKSVEKESGNCSLGTVQRESKHLIGAKPNISLLEQLQPKHQAGLEGT